MQSTEGRNSVDNHIVAPPYAQMEIHMPRSCRTISFQGRSRKDSNVIFQPSEPVARALSGQWYLGKLARKNDHEYACMLHNSSRLVLIILCAIMGDMIAPAVLEVNKLFSGLR
jgi:hypothetical protein